MDAKFSEMKKVFKEFDPVALVRMKPEPTVKKLPIKNLKKTTAFLAGAIRVHEKGWKNFKECIEKKRLKKDKLEMLKKLPGIGDISKYHLAMDIGLIDPAKPDIPLSRCGKDCATDVDTLVSFLSETYNKTKYEVDMILFRYRSGHQSSK